MACGMIERIANDLGQIMGIERHGKLRRHIDGDRACGTERPDHGRNVGGDRRQRCPRAMRNDHSSGTCKMMAETSNLAEIAQRA